MFYVFRNPFSNFFLMLATGEAILLNFRQTVSLSYNLHDNPAFCLSAGNQALDFLITFKASIH